MASSCRYKYLPAHSLHYFSYPALFSVSQKPRRARGCLSFSSASLKSVWIYHYVVAPDLACCLGIIKSCQPQADVCLLRRAANIFEMSAILIVFCIVVTKRNNQMSFACRRKAYLKANMTSKNTRSCADDNKRDLQESYVARVFLGINTCHLDASYSSLSQQHFTVFPKNDAVSYMLVARLSVPKKKTYFTAM